jgi:RNA polymerase sigma factor (sigma-70 family)
VAGSSPSLDEGSAEAFEGFYRGQFVRMARLALLLVGDRSVAEELAQEALSRVQPRFDALEAPAAYTRTVVVNLAKRHRGRDARRRAAEARSADAAEAVSSGARELLDVIDRLPYRQKVVLVLRFYEDLSEAEIAGVLGCRPGTVKSLASRALARLRTEIEEP